MLDRSFVDALVGLVLQPKLVSPEEGQLVLCPDGGLVHVPPKPTQLPEPLTFNTLGALSGYLHANRDDLVLEYLTVHVVSPTEVRLLGPLEGEDEKRATFARAVATDLVADFVNKDHQQAPFRVGVMTRFQDTEAQAALLALTVRLTEQQTLETTDDGRSQQVTAKKGVALAEQVNVPNPQHLVGFRTFREVEQVAVPYVLRVNNSGRRFDGDVPGPVLALHEADGGAWKLTAVERVVAWLRANVPAAIHVLG